MPNVLTMAPSDSEYYGGQHSSGDIGVPSTSGTSSGTTSGNYTSTPTQTNVISADQLVQSGNTPTPTSNIPSLSTSPIVANTTLPISLVPTGIFGGGSGSSSSVSEQESTNSIHKKESLLDKLKKLPDWKKGLIILAIAAGSYYGYKQLK